jgi:hypothetical protein
MATYTDVQFIGYAISTLPETYHTIGWPYSLEGRYTGLDPAVVDIDARITLTMKAVDQTRESWAVDSAPSTLKIFVMPEFAIRGTQGAYDDNPPLIDYFTYLCREFARRVACSAYESWLFVIGTIVTTDGYVRELDPEFDRKVRVREDLAVALANAWLYCDKNKNDKDASTLGTVVSNTLNDYIHYCHTHPLFKVRDRSYVVAGGSPDASYPKGLSVEKEFMSNEDFVLNLYGNVCTEEDCAYPPIHDKHGENKRRAFDELSIFTLGGIRFGVEICLDHLYARLRNNRNPDTELVQIQLVPSCGGKINTAAIIACTDGFVFNCDGQFGGSQAVEGMIWTGEPQAHTELTQVTTPCAAGKPGTANVNAQVTAPEVSTTRVAIDAPVASMLFANGPGRVHVYSPLPVPPPIPSPSPE